VAERLKGAEAEALAGEHLERAGLRILTRNYRCPQGEIDLVVEDRDVLVFVEVRYRHTSGFGSAMESVDRRKQQRLIAAARHYLAAQHIDCPCRFDVVAITGTPSTLEWLRNAFDTSP